AGMRVVILVITLYFVLEPLASTALNIMGMSPQFLIVIIVESPLERASVSPLPNATGFGVASIHGVSPVPTIGSASVNLRPLVVPVTISESISGPRALAVKQICTG